MVDEGRELGKAIAPVRAGDQARTFRLFVSSTFDDLMEERNRLHEYVFPRLGELCRRHGCRFQAIDLRWGVTAEAALDQQTVNVCLREIERCRAVTPRPHFLALLGDRYGWCPLPPQIDATELERLLEELSDDDRERLRWSEEQPATEKGWYRLDRNADPPEYRLRRREVDLSGCETREQERAARRSEAETWREIEGRLHRALEDAATKAALPPENRFKYETSLVEQEIAAGVLNVEEPADSALCVFRKISGLPDNASGYRDLTHDGGSPDVVAQKRLADLERRLRKRVPDDDCTFRARWTDDGPSTDHIGVLPENLDACLELLDGRDAPETLCARIWTRLARTILDEIERPTALPVSEKEIHIRPDLALDPEGRAHCDFANELLRFFVGREGPLEAVAGYLTHRTPQILAVVAGGGAGKSALMARALEAAKTDHPEAEIVYRFIGATPASSDGHTLLAGLCQEIARRYGKEEKTSDDFSELATELEERLGTATRERPLFLFLDALDQLSPVRGARSLSWLPRGEKLPDHVRVVVSTRREEEGVSEEEGRQRRLTDTYERLVARQPVEVDLGPMSRGEATELLGRWLEDAGRTLQDDRRTELLESFEESGGLPLYLKLAFEEARRWRSWDRPEEVVPEGSEHDRALAPGIEGIIERSLFRRLAQERHHGEGMVSRTLGYLAASRYGLAEDELLDLLSRDPDLYASFLRASRHIPPDLVARTAECLRSDGGSRAEGVAGTAATAEGRRAAERRLEELREVGRDELARFLGDVLSKPNGPRLPMVLWSRLFYDLEPYLTERRSGSASLLAFYHRELGRVAQAAYLEGDRGRELHGRMADYFNDRELSGRKIEELPWQLAEAGSWQRLCELLTDRELFFVAWESDRFDLKAHWSRLEESSSLRMVDAFAPILELAAHDSSDRSVGEIWHVRNVAELLADTGHQEEALALRRYLVSYHRQVGEPALVAMYLNDLALSYRALGRTEEALDALREKRRLEGEARPELQSDRQRLKTLNHLAMTLTDLGRLDEALDLLEKQERLARATGDNHGLSITLGNRARALLLRDGSDEEALGLLETQERICRAEDDMDGLAHALGNLGLALAARGDLERAERLLEEKEEICRRKMDRDGLAHALGARGLIRGDRGDHEGAMELLLEQERIYTELGATGSLADCLGTQAAIAGRQGEPRAALALLERQENLCRETSHRPVLQYCLGRQAVLRYEAGDTAGALARLEESARICRELTLPRDLATTLGFLALLSSERGDFAQALESYRELERLGGELGDGELLSQAVLGQVEILKNDGELDEVLTLYRRAEEKLRTWGDLELLRNVLAERADFLVERGELDAALPVFQELEGLCRQIGHRRGLVHSLDNQGTIFRLFGDPDRALAKHGEAVALLRESGQPAELAGTLGNLGVALRAHGDAERAMASYLEAEELWRRVGDREGLQRLLGNQGNLLMVGGDLVGALGRFEERAEICREIGCEEGLEKALLMQWMIHSQSGDTE